MSPETKSRETLSLVENKIHCFPRHQSLSDCYLAKQNKNALRFLRQHQATCNCTLWSPTTLVNISRVTVNCLPFDVIFFAMLPAHGIWRERVSLLDVMWPSTSQWMGALYWEKRQLYNNYCYLMSYAYSLLPLLDTSLLYPTIFAWVHQENRFHAGVECQAWNRWHTVNWLGTQTKDLLM